MVLILEVLIILVLVTIMATLIIDEQKHRRRMRHLVKVKTYWDGINRRCAVRHNVQLEVNYSRDQNSVKITRTRDISTHGIGLALDEKFMRKTPLCLDINIPGSNEPIKTHALVMWSKEMQSDDSENGKRLFHTGLKFTRFLNVNHEKKLFEYIKSIEKA